MGKHIVIVGGGFAGLNVAKKLSGTKFEITIVDVNNYHFFPPLLYQVATAFIEASNISYPFRKLFQDSKNVRFHMGKLLKVDHNSKAIETENGTLSYDYLVLAMGTETNFFNNANVTSYGLSMKTIDDALTIRNHILLKLEAATRSTSVAERSKLANIVIAGGGPTGVEMAGMLAEMATNIGTKDYPESRKRLGSIFLIDAMPTLLSPMSTKAQKEAYAVLKKLGVKIILDTQVKDFNGDEVLLSTGEKISASTLLWTSGVIAREVAGLAPEAVAKGRRLLVNEINQVQSYENIFCIGDQSLQKTDPDYPEGHPQLAQVAIQQGTLLADNLMALQKRATVKPFRYNNKGSMAIISKYRAVVDLPRGFFKGFFAWIVWLFIHIIPLVGFRNKVKLAFNWFYSFITNDPTLRLIIRARKDATDTPAKM